MNDGSNRVDWVQTGDLKGPKNEEVHHQTQQGLWVFANVYTTCKSLAETNRYPVDAWIQTSLTSAGNVMIF